MEPQKIQAEKEKSSRDKLYLAVIILLIVGCGILTWQLMERASALSTANDVIAEMNTDFEEMMNMMGINVDQEGMKTELESMLEELDLLATDNAGMQDSLIAQKQRIEQLLLDVENYKGQAAGKYKLQKELDLIREINKDLYHKIDSLNTLNENLINELDYTTGVLQTVEGERNQLEQDLNSSIDLVNKGSKLQALSMLGEAVRVKSSGAVKETDRASRAEQIRICFTLSANSIAKAGPKTVYMRVISPQGTVIANGASAGNTFETEAGPALFSEKREVNYQNDALDLCIYYILQQEIGEGDYTVELYADGVKIGTTKFYLKK